MSHANCLRSSVLSGGGIGHQPHLELSAWGSVPSGPVIWPDLLGGVFTSDREKPLVTEVNGPLMARRTVVQAALIAVPLCSPQATRKVRSGPRRRTGSCPRPSTYEPAETCRETSATPDNSAAE